MTADLLKTPFTEHARVEYPIICGAMYPCSNAELVAAVSEAGGLGIVQPLSLSYVRGIDFREGIHAIKKLTKKPFGINVIVEKSSTIYENRAKEWVDIGLEEGCRFFVTALGDPGWVVEKVHAAGGYVYHDVTEKKWAQKALDKGVDGLICVNNRAGGHAGRYSAEELMESLKSFNVPLVCAGGIGDAEGFLKALKQGYAAIQMGTRFIATVECDEKDSYKQAILKANEDDVILTERVTGVPLSVIKTPYVAQIGTKVNPVTRWLLQNRWSKPYVRMWFAITSGMRLKHVSRYGGSPKDYMQAGKSVAGIKSVDPAGAIVKEFTDYVKKSEA